jgi:hypothetical protein
MSELEDAILALLAQHAGQPVDAVALFMFLNTVAGGHYQEVCSEEDLQAALRALLAAGLIEAWRHDRKLDPEVEVAFPGDAPCLFRLTPRA